MQCTPRFEMRCSRATGDVCRCQCKGQNHGGPALPGFQKYVLRKPKLLPVSREPRTLGLQLQLDGLAVLTDGRQIDEVESDF